MNLTDDTQQLTDGRTTAVIRADDDRLADEAVELARRLLGASLAHATRAERRRQARLGRLLDDPAARALVFALTDEVLRIDDPARAAATFASAVREHPTDVLGALDGALLRTGAALAPRLPRLVMPLVRRRVRGETAGIVLPADDPAFARHVRTRRAQGVRLNVNPLGEAILGDDEADHRMRLVCERIDRPDVDHVSVKMSSLVANLDALAIDHSVDRVCERLRELYRRAQATVPATFVNLDMEEYRDLEITIRAFQRVLSEPEFHGIDAGIVLQAYLPDAHDALERLGGWASERRRAGGGRIRVRLVKGANLAMERVEAELHGWTPAPYPTKADVDASYKAMLDRALQPEWADSLRIGLASHNLFDLAWGLLRARDTGAVDRVEVEMLEGMAPAQARAVLAVSGGLLMYAPVVADDEIDASIAYLSRRLDENTQPDNFLRALFTLTPTSAEFDAQAARFRASVHARRAVPSSRRRAAEQVDGTRFANEPDGDPTDPSYRDAVLAALSAPPAVRVVPTGDASAIDRVVATARAAVRRHPDRSQRRAWLLAVADLMAAERAATIGLMADEVGKTAREGDPEVSEAIDFCRCSGAGGTELLDSVEARGLQVEARGVIAVIGPWNFPYAIPVGGVAAALAAGNAVVLKPAPEAVRTGAWIARQFWDAGVPRELLHLVVCGDDEVGTRLVTHPDVDTVVLTGSYDTARWFLDARPEMRLLAETSGKNAIVVTAAADLDQAIADLVRSAFGHAGQKCSAASLGILEASVYDDRDVRRRLADAVRSLRVGPATDPATMVGPVIGPPRGALARALTTLEPSESWLVAPRLLDDAGRLWSPGVRLDVQPGTWFHETECFGPVLGLMRADDLAHAIELQNATPFGLTGGIHSLDDDEVARWLESVEVGNAYVNRHITGAIVQRQPFGGWKRSNVGGGAKVGTDAYVLQFARLRDRADTPRPHDELATRFERVWREVLAVDTELAGLRAEANVLRHVPLGRVVVRHDGSSPDALVIASMCARATGTELVVCDARHEDDDAFVRAAAGADRARILAPVSPTTLRRLHGLDVAVLHDPLVSDPEVELRRWSREQAISRTRHRHGRLVEHTSRC